MIRNLLLIAGAGFFLATTCFAIAGAVGGFHWRDGGWASGPWAWRHAHSWPVRFEVDPSDRADDGTPATREIAWTGGDHLDIGAVANVHFTQAPGPGKLVITGPKDAVDRVRLEGGRLESDSEGWSSEPVTVTMTAPAVRRFSLSGSGDLTIDGYAQDELDVDVGGSGRVTANGKATAVRLDISGSGDADLTGLQSDRAEASISGAGHARVAPAKAADLHISGSGEIDLVSHPANVSSDVSGSGRVVEGAAASAAD